MKVIFFDNIMFFENIKDFWVFLHFVTFSEGMIFSSKSTRWPINPFGLRTPSFSYIVHGWITRFLFVSLLRICLLSSFQSLWCGNARNPNHANIWQPKEPTIVRTVLCKISHEKEFYKKWTIPQSDTNIDYQKPSPRTCELQPRLAQG